MCLADTSVRGKKWQMALFQVAHDYLNKVKSRMFTVIIFLFGGIASGWLLRNRDCGWVPS